MATYAVLQDNKVINIIVADTLEDATGVTGFNCVEYTLENPAGIGWTYNGTTFEKPPVEEVL